MAKFRKKPVVIEAEQWFPGHDIIGVCLGECRGSWRHVALGDAVAHIHTLEGAMKVSPGDYVITGVKGEKYACKPDIFAATYEPVEG